MNTLIILGHPNADSLCNALAERYAKGAARHSNIKILRLGELEFAPYSLGYNKPQKLEPDLQNAQALTLWADHLVFIYPTWWGNLPALLVGFLERIFLPDFAFRYRKNSKFPNQLLRGKTARIITTMDAPIWYHFLSTFAPGIHALQKAVLEFCGIKTRGVKIFGEVRYSNPKQRQGWLAQVEQLGVKDGKSGTSKTVVSKQQAQIQ